MKNEKQFEEQAERILQGIPMPQTMAEFVADTKNDTKENLLREFPPGDEELVRLHVKVQKHIKEELNKRVASRKLDPYYVSMKRDFARILVEEALIEFFRNHPDDQM